MKKWIDENGVTRYHSLFAPFTFEVAPLFSKSGNQLNYLSDWISNSQNRSKYQIILNKEKTQIADVVLL